jgi:predicted amino acid-binding ACT domain protein
VADDDASKVALAAASPVAGAATVVGSVMGVDTTGIVSGIGSAVTKIGSDVATITLAVALFVTGIVILLRRPLAKGSKSASKVASAVVPGGKAATVAKAAVKVAT